MSASPPAEQKSKRYALVAGGIVAGALLVLVTIVFLAASRPEPGARERDGGTDVPARSRAPALQQARWEIRRFPAGAPARMTRADRRRLRTNGPRVARVVRSIYDAAFLNRERLPDVVRNTFSPRAARSFLALRRIGAPENTVRLRTLRRAAEIGIDAQGTRRAAAAVVLRARGRLGARLVRILHRARLYLERAERGWTVVAYDIEQRPIRG